YLSNDSNVIGYYIFEDENKAIFTISKQIDKIITKDDGGTVLRKDNKYTTDLNFVFGDIKEISRKLPTAKFTHNTMIDFVKEYHSQICKTEEECIEFETKTDDKNVLVKYSIYGGYAWLNSKQTGTKNSSGAFTFGGRIELIIPRWNKSISFLLDLSYAKNKGIYDNNYSVSQIGIDVGGKYTYHKGSVRPAAEAGIALRIEKYPYNFSYAWCQFIGLGVDFLISNNKFISLILDYTISSPYHTNICTFKLGYKF
ncbi:MAG: porin family protein, partial [Prevotellaceae bacterium]|nr:porin family protein [Prevotellaceae bacterium]